MTLREWSVEAADNVRFTDVPHQENVELLGAREFTGKIKAGVPDIGVFNPEAKWRSNSLLEAAFAQQDPSGGQIVTIVARGQLQGPPTYSRDNDQDLFEQDFNLVGSNLGAADDIAIILT